MSSGRTRPKRCLSTCTGGDRDGFGRQEVGSRPRPLHEDERDRAAQGHREGSEPAAADPVHHLREAQHERRHPRGEQRVPPRVDGERLFAAEKIQAPSANERATSSAPTPNRMARGGARDRVVFAGSIDPFCRVRRGGGNGGARGQDSGMTRVVDVVRAAIAPLTPTRLFRRLAPTALPVVERPGGPHWWTSTAERAPRPFSGPPHSRREVGRTA